MNRKTTSILAMCALGISALTYSAFAQTAPVPTSPPGAPGTPGGPGAPGMHRHHSNIRNAIASLQRAEVEMKAAAHDYGGHRVDALAACDVAIAQLNLALQFAQEKPAAVPSAPTNQ